MRRRGPQNATGDPRRVLFVGDVHGALGWLKLVVREAERQRCDAIVQLGDFGYWPHTPEGRRYLAEATRLLDAANLTLWFIDGNHENFDMLWSDEHPLAEDGSQLVAPRVRYLARGQRLRWRGVELLALGGAHSIDRDWRLQAEPHPRSYWWPQETLTHRDVQRACEGGRCDILLSHDAPAGVTIFADSHSDSHVYARETESNRAAVAAVVDATRPVLVLHAHWHVRYSGQYRNQSLRLDLPVEGLDRDGSYERNWLLLDLDAFRDANGIGAEADGSTGP